MDIMTVERMLTAPEHLHSRSDVLDRPSPVPRGFGVYAWYFREAPPRVPIEDVVRWQGLFLLYVGISPRTSPKDGRSGRQWLRRRMREHMCRDASRSTLRLTLGCLLSEALTIQLRRVGRGG